jgi:hypothetical protein
MMVMILLPRVEQDTRERDSNHSRWNLNYHTYLFLQVMKISLSRFDPIDTFTNSSRRKPVNHSKPC